MTTASSWSSRGDITDSNEEDLAARADGKELREEELAGSGFVFGYGEYRVVVEVWMDTDGPRD